MVVGKPSDNFLWGKCVVRHRGLDRVRVRVGAAYALRDPADSQVQQIVASMGPGTYGTKLILPQPLKTKVITEFCTKEMK